MAPVEQIIPNHTGVPLADRNLGRRVVDLKTEQASQWANLIMSLTAPVRMRDEG